MLYFIYIYICVNIYIYILYSLSILCCISYIYILYISYSLSIPPEEQSFANFGSQCQTSLATLRRLSNNCTLTPYVNTISLSNRHHHYYHMFVPLDPYWHLGFCGDVFFCIKASVGLQEPYILAAVTGKSSNFITITCSGQQVYTV